MRLIARYAKENETHFEIVTVYDVGLEKEKIPKDAPVLHSIAVKHPAAVWFERKIHDDFGIRIEGAFDNRPLVHQERFPSGLYPMQKAFDKTQIEEDPYKPYAYEAIGGDGVFQVSVGPIHAGIIEPGHFHFSQAGEDMLHQEVRHFYKYRAVEKMLEGKTLWEAKAVIERISGNESIAYQTVWRDILLEASGTELPVSLRKTHALLLEMERLAHHFTDLGFIPNDAGFGAALAYGSRLSEDVRRQLKALSGHRFGFGAISLEGVSMDREAMSEWIEEITSRLDFFESWINDIPSLWDRFDTTGILSQQNALAYDTVGIVARASGVAVDRRATPFYEAHGFAVQTGERGDVSARFKLRLAEAKHTLEMMHNLLDEKSEKVEAGSVKDGEYHSFAESSIGELFMAIDIKEGVIERFFVRDPSFMNWQALHLMMPGNIIADFPLINKSCDLSYAGNDL